MKAALGDSLKAEEAAVRNRFEKAESVLGTSGTTEVPEEKLEREVTRVVRDSFSLPADDYELISAIKDRCLGLSVSITKSEAIRAGLHALQQLSDKELLSVVGELEKVKTGRPTRKRI
jgi:hypothetical protein